MLRYAGIVTALVLALTCPVTAQFQSSLTTTFNHNNGQSGNMFDIVAANDVTICGLDINVDPTGPWNVEVYVVTGGGTYVGNETNAGAWTLTATANNVSSTGQGNPTPVPVTLGVTIPQGTTQGFYVTLSNGTGINYTNGTAAGAVFAQDSNIQILEGVGKSYPFGSTFTPRVWNGTIYYEPGQATGCVLPRPPGEFQVNQPGSTLTIDGAPDPGTISPIQVTAPVNSQHSLDMSSVNVSQGFDLLVVAGPAQGFSTLGLSTSGGQVINLDPSDPSAIYMNGFFLGAFPLSGSFSIPFAVGVPVTVSAQMAVLDPTTPSSLAISHAVEFTAQ